MVSNFLTVEELAHLYVLDSLKGFGPQKFKQLFQAGIPPKDVIRNPALLPITGKRGGPIREQLKANSTKLLADCTKRAEKQLKIAESTKSHIVTYGHALYPKHVFHSNNPIAILYARGHENLLGAEKTVACVGSRKIRVPYLLLHLDFVRAAVKADFTVVSGFALGADTLGHRAAVEHGGKTICVMPSGLDRPFPPENKELWQSFLNNPNAVFVSEFPFGMGAASLNLRKRNKLIVAFAQGVLVSQTSVTGGAMNAYRFAIEQKKPIATFCDDTTEDTGGNRLIANAEKYPATVFNLDTTGPTPYQEWLHKLSSST